jgi:Holliday junction resolvasome RuvABC DNA-binding subunit
MAADEMAAAIRGNDVALLTRIPGIGKKTAERMVLELRDKLPQVAGASTPTVPAMSAMEEDVLSALVNLGYQQAAAEKALASVVKNGKSVNRVLPKESMQRRSGNARSSRAGTTPLSSTHSLRSPRSSSSFTTKDMASRS